MTCLRARGDANSLSRRAGLGFAMFPRFPSPVPVWTDAKPAPTPSSLSLCFYPRATEAAGSEATAVFMAAVRGGASKSKTYAVEVRVTEPKWASLQQHLTPFLAAMVSGWRANMSADTGNS